MSEVLKTIKNRRSYRSFKDEPVAKEKIEAILKAAMFAPSARHERRWQFVVVEDQKKIQQLSQIKPGAEFIAQAPAVIAIVSPEWKYWLQDTSIAGAHIYLEAEHQDLGTCWVNVSGSQDKDGGDAEEYVRQVLDMDKNLRVTCIMPVGEPNQQKAPHSEAEFEQDKIHWL